MARSADTKPQNYRDANGKLKTRMVPTDKDVVKDKIDEISADLKSYYRGKSMDDHAHQNNVRRHASTDKERAEGERKMKNRSKGITRSLRSVAWDKTNDSYEPEGEMVNEGRVEISKSQYKKLKDKHMAAKAGTITPNGVSTGKPHAHTVHVYKDKSGEVHRQHYSHKSYGLPSIETNASGTKHYMYKESVDLEEAAYKVPLTYHAMMARKKKAAAKASKEKWSAADADYLKKNTTKQEKEWDGKEGTQTASLKKRKLPEETQMQEGKDPHAGQPVGVHIHMKDKSGKIHKTTFLGTHSAVAGATKHIKDMSAKGMKLHKKELAFAESVEHLDELKKSTLGSYIKKASRSARASSTLAKDFDNEATPHLSKMNKHTPNIVSFNKDGTRFKGDKGEYKAAKKKYDAAKGLSTDFQRKSNNRIKGIARAADRLTKEDVEYRAKVLATGRKKFFSSDKFKKMEADRAKKQAEYKASDRYKGRANESTELSEANYNGTIRLGGESHPMKRIPIKHHDEYKSKFPGSKVAYRGPKQGKYNTSKGDATHFYVVKHKDPIGTQKRVAIEGVTYNRDK